MQVGGVCSAGGWCAVQVGGVQCRWVVCSAGGWCAVQVGVVGSSSYMVVVPPPLSA